MLTDARRPTKDGWLLRCYRFVSLALVIGQRNIFCCKYRQSHEAKSKFQKICVPRNLTHCVYDVAGTAHAQC